MKVNEVIIVEGKYDKIKLSQFIDGLIIVTNGFNIFNNKNNRDFIKKMADERGIVILTDSDSSGFLIRNYIKSFVDSSKIKNAYIPQLLGKEKRKNKFSKEGYLGVEGLNENIIREALVNAGVSSIKRTNHDYITLNDLYDLGLTGNNNSKILRQELYRHYNLPSYLNIKDFINVINEKMSRGDFILEYSRIRGDVSRNDTNSIKE